MQVTITTEDDQIFPVTLEEGETVGGLKDRLQGVCFIEAHAIELWHNGQRLVNGYCLTYLCVCVCIAIAVLQSCLYCYTLYEWGAILQYFRLFK